MEHLKKRIGRGETEALVEVYDLLGDRLMRYLSARLNPTDAQDVLQGVFNRVVRHHKRFSKSKKLTAAVFLTARNEANRWLEKRRTGIDSITEFSTWIPNQKSTVLQNRWINRSNTENWLLVLPASCPPQIVKSLNSKSILSLRLLRLPRPCACPLERSRPITADQSIGRLRLLPKLVSAGASTSQITLTANNILKKLFRLDARY